MLDLRPEVAAFAQLMEAQLRLHDDRPGWKQERLAYLWRRMTEEREELYTALTTRLGDPIQIALEAANVANFCMMIADVSRGLVVPVAEDRAWQDAQPR